MGVEFLHPFVSLLTAFKTTIERTLLGFYKVQTILQVFVYSKRNIQSEDFVLIRLSTDPFLLKITFKLRISMRTIKVLKAPYSAGTNFKSNLELN